MFDSDFLPLTSLLIVVEEVKAVEVAESNDVTVRAAGTKREVLTLLVLGVVEPVDEIAVHIVATYLLIVSSCNYMLTEAKSIGYRMMQHNLLGLLRLNVVAID